MSTTSATTSRKPLLGLPLIQQAHTLLYVLRVTSQAAETIKLQTPNKQ